MFNSIIKPKFSFVIEKEFTNAQLSKLTVRIECVSDPPIKWLDDIAWSLSGLAAAVEKSEQTEA